MGRWGRYDDRTDFWKDMVIVYCHPDFRDQKPIDALGDLYAHRHEQRREEHRQRLTTDD